MNYLPNSVHDWKRVHGKTKIYEGAQPKEDWHELFRRMIFNILTSNFDDHLRNHGFLREAKGWRLSPVYDLESTPGKIAEHQTFISMFEGDSFLELALENVEDFSLTLNEAKEIIRSVADAVRRWEMVARQAGATKSDIEIMSGAYNRGELMKTLRM